MEQATVFDVAGETLPGILHAPENALTVGVLIVVGGPQYRVGSHRQFLLLARSLARQGIPVFRFDYRGMGDAAGDRRDFEQIDADLRAALSEFQRLRPDLTGIVVWGLCDAASAALLHVPDDDRVVGMALVNPWVRTEQGLARARLRHYYLRRAFSRELWVKLLRGGSSPWRMLRGFLGTATATRSVAGQGAPPAKPLPERMAAGWESFGGPILLILSGQDLTAREFIDTAQRAPAWRGLLNQSRVTRHELSEANHTFSRREWRAAVEQWTVDWVHALPAAAGGPLEPRPELPAP